jgi:hypothetical protein
LTAVEALEKANRSLVEAASLLSGQVYEYLSREAIAEDSVPSGYLGTRRSKKQGMFRRGHRVVQYSQPLSDRLRSKYRLIPLSPVVPAVLKDALWSFGSHVRTSVIDNSEFEMDLGGGKTIFIELDDSGDWAVSMQNLSGRTLGRVRTFPNLDKVIPMLWDYLSEKQKMRFIKRVLPAF